MTIGDVTLGGSLGTKAIKLLSDRDTIACRAAPSVTISGDMGLTTVTTGVTSGAAGTGTTTTSIVKPTGAANWTANNMAGKFVRITSGAAAGEIRPIMDNGTTTITVHTITGLAATHHFEIVVPKYEVGFINLSDIQQTVTIENTEIARLDIARINHVTIRNCLFSTPLADGSIGADDNGRVDMINCSFSSNASMTLNRASMLSATNIVLRTGWFWIIACNEILIGIYADGCGDTALKLEQILKGAIGIEAQGCTATPVHMIACNHITPDGVGFIGTNAGATYGILMEQGGYYDLTAGTLSGASDLRIEDGTATWTQLGYHKTICRRGVVGMTTA